MDNSPKTEKYPDIEYVLHIYDTIWDYLQTATFCGNQRNKAGTRRKFQPCQN